MEYKCLTKASEILFITRSPLGKTISELETLLGEKLFIREHGLYQPTHFAQEVYEQALPLYQKLLNLEEYLINSCHSRRINIILDDSFPDNLADIMYSSLSKTEFIFHFSRKTINQDIIDSMAPGPDALFITLKNLVPDSDTQRQNATSSSFLLVSNHPIDSPRESIKNTPLLFRSNMAGTNVGYPGSLLQKKLGFTPKIRYINGTVFDCLLMTGKGSGLMLLPLKTCALININRNNTLLLDELKLTTYFYYRQKARNRKEINAIINHIAALF